MSIRMQGLSLWVISIVAMGLSQHGWTQDDGDPARLLSGIQSGDAPDRIRAIERLGQSPAVSDEIVAALRELYLVDGNDQVRRTARIVLGQISTRRPKRAAGPTTPFVFNAPAAKRDVINVRLIVPGGFGPAKEFSRDEYRTPEPPTERVAQFINQLKKDPQSSERASAELAKLGAEAITASSALIEIMMRRGNEWRDARIAASEALEKINPELQKPVWAILVEQSTDMSIVAPRLSAIAFLGPKGYPAMPVVLAYWNAPAKTGYRVNADLLATMHAIALRDPKVTEEIVRVLKGEISVGDNTLRYAIDICDERELPVQQILDLLTPYVLKNQPPGYAADKLIEMVNEKQLSPEPVVKLLMTCIDQGINQHKYIADLGHFGPAAKEGLPLLRRLKFEDKDQRVRKAADEAMKLIDR